MSFLIILLCFCFLNSFHPGESIRQSYTLSGKRCISECLSYTYYRYCYYTFYNWDYCELNKTGRDVQYFTSLLKDTQANCSSHCDFFEYEYEWCLVGPMNIGKGVSAGWSWDYCSSLAEYSVYGNKCISKCVKGEGGSYGCIVRDAAMPGKKYEACGPDPVIISENKTGRPNFVVDMIMIENNDIGTDLRYEVE